MELEEQPPAVPPKSPPPVPTKDEQKENMLGIGRQAKNFEANKVWCFDFPGMRCVKDNSKMGKTDKDLQLDAVALWSWGIVAHKSVQFAGTILWNCACSPFSPSTPTPTPTHPLTFSFISSPTPMIVNIPRKS